MHSGCSAYFFRKLVEISSRVRSHGEDKDERGSRGGVSEHQTQFSRLRLNEPLAQVVGNKVLREYIINNSELYSYTMMLLQQVYGNLANGYNIFHLGYYCVCLFVHTCILLVSLSARMHFRTIIFWKSSRSVFQWPGRGSLWGSTLSNIFLNPSA